MVFIEKDYLLSKVSDGEIYVNLVSTSKSGMTRKMRFYIVHNGKLVNVTKEICNLGGYKLVNGTLQVKGVGMDMVFHVLNSVCRNNKIEYYGDYTMV